MSYQVIARKYRPQKFEDVVGQEHVTQTLANAVRQNRIAHAYLFCGPRGTGKTTIARIFAKALNCTAGPKAEFDENDPKVKEIAEGRALDVLEIDAASNRGIDEIRELRETARYAPASSKFKIYIVDEVHMLTKEAFNALLKTLEEPPAHVKFLFATTDPEKVLPTILSRCQRFDLRRIPSALIIKHLAEISKQEGVKIEEAALYAIARGAEGGMRDAESTLDQLISFCGNEITEADVLSMFGLTAQSQILNLANAIIAGESETALRELNELVKHGKDLSRLISDLLNYFRNLLLFQVSKGDMSLLEVSEGEAATLKKQSGLISAETLTRIMDVFTSAEGQLRDAASKKIFVEVTLLKAIEARNAVSIDAVLKQLQDLRAGKAPAASAAPAPAPTRTVASPAPAPTPKASAPAVMRETPAPKPAAAPASTATAAATPANVDLSTLWQQLLDAFGKARPFLRSYLLEAHPISLVKNILTIGFDPEFSGHMTMVDNSPTHTVLQTKLNELGYGHCQVKFIESERPEGWVKPAEPEPAPTPAPAQPSAPAAAAPKASGEQAAPAPAAKARPEPVPFNKDDFKNDPLIQKALEVFKGQIVEVRS